MELIQKNSRAMSNDESVNTPASRGSQMYKSVRSGGALISKALNQVTTTL